MIQATARYHATTGHDRLGHFHALQRAGMPAQVRLRHVDTQAYLSAHDLRFGNPIAGQYEVYCGQYKGKAAEWQAAEGVYLPQPVTDGDAEALPAADDEL